jgi:hypothetical protein
MVFASLLIISSGTDLYAQLKKETTNILEVVSEMNIRPGNVACVL